MDYLQLLGDHNVRAYILKEAIAVPALLIMLVTVINTFKVSTIEAWFRTAPTAVLAQPQSGQNKNKLSLSMIYLLPAFKTGLPDYPGYGELGYVLCLYPIVLFSAVLFGIMPLFGETLIGAFVAVAIGCIMVPLYGLVRYGWEKSGAAQGAASVRSPAVLLSLILSFVLTQYSVHTNSWIYWDFGTTVVCVVVSLLVAFGVWCISSPSQAYADLHTLALRTHGYHPIHRPKGHGTWMGALDSMVRWSGFMIPVLVAFLAISPVAPLFGRETISAPIATPTPTPISKPRIEDMFNKPNIQKEEEEENEEKEIEEEEIPLREPWSPFAVDCLRALPFVLWGILRYFSAIGHTTQPFIFTASLIAPLLDLSTMHIKSKDPLVVERINRTLQAHRTKVCLSSLGDLSVSLLAISVGLVTLGIHTVSSTPYLYTNYIMFICGQIASWWFLLCVFHIVRGDKAKSE